MNKYILSIAFSLIAWFGNSGAQSPENVQRAKAYDSYNELFERATEKDATLLNILGLMYKELPVTTTQDQKAKKKIAENFEAKFHKSIDNFPTSEPGFFAQSNYEDIALKILKQNLHVVPTIIKQAEELKHKDAEKSENRIHKAFISLSDAFHTYNSLANAKSDLLNQARKQLDALKAKHPALTKLEEAIEERFNETYISKNIHYLPFSTSRTFSSVRALSSYILEETDKLLSALRPEFSMGKPLHSYMADQIDPILGMSGMLRLIFWIMQFKALKKPENPVILKSVHEFEEGLRETEMVVDYYETSLSRQQHRDVLEATEKALANRIRSTMEQEDRVCIHGECIRIMGNLENLIYYLMRYASLKGSNVSLIHKALDHIKNLIDAPEKIDLRLVPFANAGDELRVIMIDEARRHPIS